MTLNQKISEWEWKEEKRRSDEMEAREAEDEQRVTNDDEVVFSFQGNIIDGAKKIFGRWIR